MEKEKTVLDRMNSWIKNSVTLKLITITILVLLLLIPISMIESVINERESLNNQATREVSSKWADQQLICGPIMTIPLIYEYEKVEGDPVQTTKFLHLLPDDLQVVGEVFPQELKRGIYKIIVYKSKLDFKGEFSVKKEIDYSNLKEIQWNKAFLTLGISDLRGIEEEVSLKWNEETLEVEPGSRIEDLIYSGITVDIDNLEDLLDQPISFSFDLKLQGSRNLSFIPVGSNTDITLSSTWPSPSFDGSFLPDDRTVTDDGFNANWKVLQLNRNFPQKWVGDTNNQKLKQSSFGVNLIQPLDDYQKSFRSAKYALMTIGLTFLIFFLVEILNGRKIHPFQYILVGLALSIFYVLLVSISEHTSFNFAYLVSALAIVVMISLYSLTVFKARKLTFLLVATLIGIYGFLFVTLQLSDYALLMGSIGLTLILAATMYFTRKINWYNLNRES